MQNKTRVDVVARGPENRESRMKLGRDYIENQRDLRKHRGPVGNECVQNDALVFSGRDDFKLYGKEALEYEFLNRQYDPYSLYKQRVADLLTRLQSTELPETA